MRKLLQISALGLGLAGCIKSNEFFATDLDEAGITDVDPPEFVIYLPTTSGPLNLTTFDFDVNDLTGSNGVTPSGPNYTTIEVRNGQGLIPLARNGNRFQANLSGVPDGGPYLFGFSGRDNQGNLGQVTRSMFLDRQGPQISITSGSLPASSADASVPFSYSGSIQDPNLNTATIVIKRAGTNGICGDADDVVWPVGTGPGQISAGSFPLTPAASNPFAISFNAQNGVPSGGQPANAVYCAEVSASDNAIGLNGPAPNMSTFSLRKELRWDPLDQPPPPPPQDPVYSVSSCHRHVAPGNSYVGWNVMGTPSAVAAGKPYSFTASGPGIVGSATYSGSVPANGLFFLQTNINLFGNYSLSGQVGGIAVTDTHSVDGSSDPNCGT